MEQPPANASAAPYPLGHLGQPSANASTASYPPGYLEQSRSATVQNVAIALIVLTTVGLALRFRARQLQDVKWMWGDVFMPLSLLFNLALCSVALVSVKYGMGKHAQTLSEEQIITVNKLINFIAPCLYLVSVVWAKLAILDLYLFIFRERYMRITSYFLGTIIILNCVITLAIFMAKCTPFEANWRPVPGAHCVKLNGQVAAWSGVVNVFTDLFMIVLPIPMMIKLMRPTRVKVGIYFTFLIGNIGLAASIARFVETWVLVDDIRNAQAFDFTWFIIRELLVSIAEPATYHVAACLMTFRPLIQSVMVDKYVQMVMSRLTSIVSKSTLRSSSDHIDMIENSREGGSGIGVGVVSYNKSKNSTVSVQALNTSSSTRSTDQRKSQITVSNADDVEASYSESSRTPTSEYVTFVKDF